MNKRMYRTLYNTVFLILFIFVVISVFSCSPKYFRVSHMEKMKWIEGHWLSTEEGITISETWKYVPDQGFNGLSFIAVSKDTLFKEQIQIKFGSGRTIILETISGQVQLEKSEPMKLIKISNKRFVFQTDDEKKTIIYRNKKSGEMQIDLSEMSENELMSTKYLLKKI